MTNGSTLSFMEIDILHSLCKIVSKLLQFGYWEEDCLCIIYGISLMSSRMNLVSFCTVKLNFSSAIVIQLPFCLVLNAVSDREDLPDDLHNFSVCVQFMKNSLLN